MLRQLGRPGSCQLFSRRFVAALSPSWVARRHATTEGQHGLSEEEDMDASMLDIIVENDDTPPASSPSASSSPAREVEVEEEGQHAARRQLFEAAARLRRAVQKELHDEVARDTEDGVAALPPLAPAGWAVHHPPGHRYFVMTRELHKQTGEGAASEEEDEQRDGPRYRSVHDTFFSSSAEKKQQQKSREDATEGQWVLQKGGGYTPTGRLQPLDNYTPSNKLAAKHVARSDVRVTLYAPFRVLDLSLYNNDVPIVEHSVFDVLIHKHKPRRPSRHQVQLDPQQKVWDDETALFVGLASVNSELRIRHLQFLPRYLTRALREQAVFGSGDPHYEALVQRQQAALLERDAERAQRLRSRQEAHRRHQARQQQQQGRVDAVELPPASTPSTRVLQPGDLSATPADANVTHYELNKEKEQEGHLLKHFGVVGDYARLYGYKGPHMTELSKELQESLLHYLAVDLGLNEEVREYVCQSQYVMEQEEYTQWLARWDQVATHLQRRL